MEFNIEAAIEQEEDVELVIMYLLGSGRIILEHHIYRSMEELPRFCFAPLAQQ